MPYSLAAASSGQVFSHARIALTAAVTGLLALGAAWWRLPRRAWAGTTAIALLSAASVNFIYGTAGWKQIGCVTPSCGYRAE
jgi:hypothetical protein